jgi:2-oxoisovalerate ferredoxin oxidoreductase gamma subunit
MRGNNFRKHIFGEKNLFFGGCMIELRFHGRAGQGMVTAAELLATAASMDEKFAQALPVFGSEKRGPPVTAYCRISDAPIIVHEEITEPDIVVVADPSILASVDVTKGLKKNGVVIVNSPKQPEELSIKAKHVFSIDGTEIALKNLGKPITNTVMLGALVKITGIVKIDSVNKALKAKFASKFPQEVIDANIATIKECFDQMPEKNLFAQVSA